MIFFVPIHIVTELLLSFTFSCIFIIVDHSSFNPLVFHCSFSFLVGLVISSIMLSVVDSSVNTVVVSFAEAPAEFEQNHPELSSEMRDAWMKVYPTECGF